MATLNMVDAANDSNIVDTQDNLSPAIRDSDIPHSPESNEQVQHDDDESLLEEPRLRGPPTYLKDYYFNNAAAIDPSCTSSCPASPLGKPYPISYFISYDNASPTYKAYLDAIMSHDKPKCFSQAVQFPQWRDAMALEIKALEDNNTWSFQELPPGRKLVGCKWVYRIKYKAN